VGRYKRVTREGVTGMGQIALSVLSILAWAVAVAIALLVAIVILLLVLPVKIRLQGSGRIEDWSQLLESFSGRLDEYRPLGAFGRWRFSLDASVMAGVVSASASGSFGWQENLDVEEPADGFSGVVRVLGIEIKGFSTGRSRRESRASEKTSNAEKRPEVEEKHSRKTQKRLVKRFSLQDITKFFAREVRGRILSSLRSFLKNMHLNFEADIELGLSDPAETGIIYGLAECLRGVAGINGLRVTPNFRSDVLTLDGFSSLSFIPAQIGFVAGRFLLSKEIRPLWRKQKLKGRRGEHAHRKEFDGFGKASGGHPSMYGTITP